jgi:hypothetical protein
MDSLSLLMDSLALQTWVKTPKVSLYVPYILRYEQNTISLPAILNLKMAAITM